MSEHISRSTSSSKLEALDWLKPYWEFSKTVAIGVAAVFSFFASQTAEKIKLTTDQAKLAMEQRSQQSVLDIKAYELVEKTLSLDPASRKEHGIAAAAIVNALTKPPLLDGLQRALRAGIGDPELTRKLDDAQKFDLENYPTDLPDADFSAQGQSALFGRALAIAGNTLVTSAWAQADSGTLKGYRVDIFYCEAASPSKTAARKARADEAFKKLNNSNSGVEVRVRLLPSLIQARPGYQSSSDEIRFNNEGNEREAASDLAKIIGIKADAIRPIDYRTSGYISAFYCSGI